MHVIGFLCPLVPWCMRNLVWPPTPTPSGESIGPVPPNSLLHTDPVPRGRCDQPDLSFFVSHQLGTKPSRTATRKPSRKRPCKTRRQVFNTGTTGSNQTPHWHGDPQPQEVTAWCVAAALPTHNPCGLPIAQEPSWGDPRSCVCQAPNAFTCVSPCGSILGPFWVHFGSILGPFWVHFGSILGPFLDLLGPFWVHFAHCLSGDAF